MKYESYINKKTWDEFRATGLLFFINQILHAFGWAITCDVEDGKVIDVYPARVKFRGFSEDVVAKNYRKIGEYIENNHKDIYEESLL